MRRWGVIAAVTVGAVVFGAVMPGLAQTPPVAVPTGRPDVVFLVIPQAGQADTVDITYAHAIPHAQAQRDLDALVQATRWTTGPRRITDGPSPIEKGKVMTASVFTVPGGIQDSAGSLPVEQVLTAFRPYKRLVLIFSVGPGYQFQGPRDFADNDVQIALQQRATLYTYQVRILNPQFSHLNLPRPAGVGGSVSSRKSPWVLLLGILAAAGAAGVLVYVLMTRKMPPPPPRANTDALAEGRTKIGTKG